MSKCWSSCQPNGKSLKRRYSSSLSQACLIYTSDGNVIRLVFPEVTEERRKALVKDVKKKGEDAKVAVRNVRRDGNDFLKKLGKEDVAEDEIKELEDQLQKLTDKFGKDIDKLVEAKSKEIMTV